MMSIFEYVPTLFLIAAIYLANKKAVSARKIAEKAWIEKPSYPELEWYTKKQLMIRLDQIKSAAENAVNKKLGLTEKLIIKAAIAEKTADRAFNMASSANLGVVALQKALAVPRLMTKQQGLQNKFAKNEVDKLFNGEGTFDWLRPILSDEELEIIDKAEELKERQMNGEHKI